MQEEFVQFVWHHGLFENKPLKTIHQGEIILFDRGLLNSDAGPDFTNARISIDGQSWAGAIEIHVKASEWKAHKHKEDPRYNSVVLHVVWEYDNFDALRSDGSIIPTLELKSLVNHSVLENHYALHGQLSMVPCAKLNPMHYEMNVKSALHRALADRMIQKSNRLVKLVKNHTNDWQQVFYIATARYLGMKVNAEAMEELASRTPNELLAKNKESLFRTEALLFGQSGFLDAPSLDQYHTDLKKEYDYLKKKHSITSMSVLQWKFSRMRPSNFPTIRIAQLAGIVFNQLHLFSKVIEERQVVKLKSYFAVELSEYWQEHFSFGKKTVKGSKRLGNNSIESLLINVVAPILFAYGKHRGDDAMTERAFDLLELLKPESNKYTRFYECIGFSNESAYDSQAILGLKENYCDKRLCTKCSIGIKMLTQS